MCHQLRSGSGAERARRSPGWCRRACSNILSSTGFTHPTLQGGAPATAHGRPRQAGCMARSEKRRTAPRLPKQIAQAVAAAEDKKADNLVVLDLRKAAGFTDYFVICSGHN